MYLKHQLNALSSRRRILMEGVASVDELDDQDKAEVNMIEEQIDRIQARQAKEPREEVLDFAKGMV